MPLYSNRKPDDPFVNPRDVRYKDLALLMRQRRDAEERAAFNDERGLRPGEHRPTKIGGKTYHYGQPRQLKLFD